MTHVSAFYSKKLVQTFCVHRDKSVLKMRLTLFVLFWLEGGLAEVWQATLLSFLSHSTAAKKNEVPGDVFSVCVQPGAQHVGIVCELAQADSTSEFRTLIMFVYFNANFI